MFRRLFWLVLGMGVGFGGSFWVTRYVRQTVARYTPERISSDMADRVRGLGADVRLAVAEGRQAMLEREAALRAGGPTNGHGPSRADATGPSTR